MPHTISNDFEFSYGHRVWTQSLNGEYSSNLKCSCRHIHGHNAKVTVTLTAAQLTDGMVTDFRHLEWLKKFLDTFIDHQFVIDRNDPLYNRLVGSVNLTAVTVPGRDRVVGYIVDSEEFKKYSAAEQEMLEGIFVVNFTPTSENLCHWLQGVVQEKMKELGVTVSSIVWWESSKSRSEYSV